MSQAFGLNDLRRLAGILPDRVIPADLDFDIDAIDLRKIKKHRLKKVELEQIITDLLNQIDLWRVQITERNQFAAYILTDVAAKLANPNNPVSMGIAKTVQGFAQLDIGED